LVPFFADAHRLPAEDALGLSAKGGRGRKDAKVRIAVPVLPHVSNFDDLDPLDAEPEVEVVKVWPGSALPGDADLVILLGSKSTIADLAALRKAGFDVDIAAHLRRGGHVLGLCGGYQMLGRRLHDPDGVEGPAASVDGLGLLDVETRLTAEKRLVAVTGTTAGGQPFSGYEMHMGATEGPDTARPFARLADGSAEGAASAEGRVSGTYVHGLFSNDRQRANWLARFGASGGGLDYEAGVDATLDGLAAHLEKHVDLDRLIGHAQ
jgi:adenosylcobyric acid synthase